MAGVITASLVVNFGDSGEQGLLSAEIDSREEGYNGGTTGFSPGQQPVFLVYHTSNVTPAVPKPSLGSVQKVAGPQNQAQSEFLTFANKNEATLSKPAKGAFTYTWIGNNLGVPKITDEYKVAVPTVGVGVLKVEYTTQFTPWRLTNIPSEVSGLTSFQVIVYISGTVT